MKNKRMQFYFLLLNLLFMFCACNVKKYDKNSFKNRNVKNKKKITNKTRKDTFRRKVIKSTDLPSFLAEDVIQVYHMRTKTLPFIGTSFGVFDAHTSGMAFRSERTDTVVTLEFLPLNNSMVYLPQVLSHNGNNGNINTRLIWNKQATLWYSNYIDMNYWQTSTYLADINGNVMSHFIGWLEKTYMKSSSFYIPQTICAISSLEVVKKSPLLPSNNQKCYLSARTSDSFIQSVLQKLASLAVYMKPLTPPPVTEIIMVTSSTPEDVFLESGAITSELGQDIVNYYINLEKCMRSLVNRNVDVNNNNISRSSNGSIRLNSNGNGRYSYVVSQCMKGVGTAYVHLGRDHYVKITPPSILKHPSMTFASVYEGTQAVPTRMAIPAPGPSVYDHMIGLCLVLAMLIGIIFSLQKLRLIELFTSELDSRDGSRIRSKRRISSNVPIEGGYSKSSELPKYVEWSWHLKSSSNDGVVVGSNDDGDDDIRDDVEMDLQTPVGKAGLEWHRSSSSKSSNSSNNSSSNNKDFSHNSPATIHSNSRHQNNNNYHTTLSPGLGLGLSVAVSIASENDSPSSSSNDNVAYSKLQVNEE